MSGLVLLLTRLVGLARVLLLLLAGAIGLLAGLLLVGVLLLLLLLLVGILLLVVELRHFHTPSDQICRQTQLLV